MQRTTRASSDNEMDRHFQVQSTSTVNPPAQQVEHHPRSDHISSDYHERYIYHPTHQQQRHQQQHHQRNQISPVSFGIYAPLQQETAPSISFAPSLPRPSSTSSSMPSTTPSHFVVKEETTTVKVPMLRPRPGLLKVLHLSGGVGETFTMGEVINHVKEYIRDRALYDEQDPRVVHCAGDLLGVALGVDTFTVHDAIGLFQKNCTMEPDSCIRIHRHLVTRSVNPQQQTPPRNGAASYTAVSGTGSTTVSPSTMSSHLPPAVKSNTNSPLRTDVSRMQPTELDICTSIQNILQSYPGHSLPSSSTTSSLSKSLPSSSSSSYLPSSSSSSSSAVIKFKAAQSFVTVTDSDPEKSSGEQIAPSSDSSSDEGRSGRFKGQHRRKGPAKSNAQKRTRQTSINVTYDEPDGATDPWTCEVMMETSAGGMSKPENDTLVVEFDSDAFSVEYEVESDPETDPGGAKPAADQACVESDESSSTSGAAILLVCKESDVEYLADYSDSDNGSNAEFSDALNGKDGHSKTTVEELIDEKQAFFFEGEDVPTADTLKTQDQWGCEHCLMKNPPFQRNCAGCWSVRPDWLPSTSKETREGASCDRQDTTVPEPSSDNLESLPSQQNKDSKEDFKCSLEKSSDTLNLNKSSSQMDKNTNCMSRRRRCSSSLSTSDSQDCRKKGKIDTVQGSVGMPLSDESKLSDKRKTVDTLSARDDPCIVCLTRRKTASIIHGKTGHQVCCYRCARRLKEQRKPCPICRRPIQKVIRNFLL